jgi:hypothetical protein
MSDPAKHHGHALKNPLRYVKSTIQQKLRYGPGGAYDHMIIYSDVRLYSIFTYIIRRT